MVKHRCMKLSILYYNSKGRPTQYMKKYKDINNRWAQKKKKTKMKRRPMRKHYKVEICAKIYDNLNNQEYLVKNQENKVL